MQPLSDSESGSSICGWDVNNVSEPDSPARKLKKLIKKSKDKSRHILKQKLEEHVESFSDNKKHYKQSEIINRQRSKTQSNNSLKVQEPRSELPNEKPNLDKRSMLPSVSCTKKDLLFLYGINSWSMNPSYQKILLKQEFQSFMSGTRTPLKKAGQKSLKVQSTSLSQPSDSNRVLNIKNEGNKKIQSKHRSSSLHIPKDLMSSFQTKYIKRSWKDRTRINSNI